MQFGLLDDHPDAVNFAEALLATNRHCLVATTARLTDTLQQRLGNPRWSPDAEELLADPAVEMVIVAGRAFVRAEQLRRALQSERHVVCVHPADIKADTAYEAALLQGDSKCLLYPLLPEPFHPGVERLAQFVDQKAESTSAVGTFRLLCFERHSRGEVLENTEESLEPAVPGWDILRRLGGEPSEVSSFTDGEHLIAGKPVLLAGRFQKGGMFQVTLIPHQPEELRRLTLFGTKGQVELLWPQGWDGPAFLTWKQDGRTVEEFWPRWDPWPVLVTNFERALQSEAKEVYWQDEVRCLELDDAARRSRHYRRVHLMEYQEAGEEVGFKGTMTLVGCSLMWAVLLLLIVSRWFPILGWVILPLLVIFIGLQFFRYIIPKPERKQEISADLSPAPREGLSSEAIKPADSEHLSRKS